MNKGKLKNVKTVEQSHEVNSNPLTKQLGVFVLVLVESEIKST